MGFYIWIDQDYITEKDEMSKKKHAYFKVPLILGRSVEVGFCGYFK